jgi:hypothetical protein
MSIFRGISSVRGLNKFISVGPVQLVDQANFTTVQSSGGIRTLFRSSTGYTKIEWWDGTTNVIGNGSQFFHEYTKAISSPYNNSNPKTFNAYSCTSGGARSGYMVGVNVFASSDFGVPPISNFTQYDVSGCTNLLYLTFNGVQGTADASNLTNLTQLSVNEGINTTSINITNCNLTGLFLNSCNFSSSITNFITGLSSNNTISTFQVASTTGLTDLDLSGLSLPLNIFVAIDNLTLSSVDVSNLSTLINVTMNGNSSLSSVRAIGVGGAMSYSGISKSYVSVGQGFNLTNCNLDASALDQFYTDLDSTSAANIFVFNNPGVGDDDPTIATDKGYAVYGS